MLAHIIMTGLLATFIILFITKTGLRDWIAERSPELIYKMLNCDFCLSFWVGLILAIGFLIAGGPWFYIFIPMFSAPITRFLL